MLIPKIVGGFELSGAGEEEADDQQATHITHGSHQKRQQPPGVKVFEIPYRQFIAGPNQEAYSCAHGCGIKIQRQPVQTSRTNFIGFPLFRCHAAQIDQNQNKQHQGSGAEADEFKPINPKLRKQIPCPAHVRPKGPGEQVDFHPVIFLCLNPADSSAILCACFIGIVEPALLPVIGRHGGRSIGFRIDFVILINIALDFKHCGIVGIYNGFIYCRLVSLGITDLVVQLLSRHIHDHIEPLVGIKFLKGIRVILIEVIIQIEFGAIAQCFA